MNCENLSGNEKNICEEDYCYSKGSIDKTDDSCICNEYCIGGNCDGPNSWKFTCDQHSGTGVSTDEECKVCEDCVCSASETTYIPPTRVGDISKIDNSNLLFPTPEVETLVINNNMTLTPDATYITQSPNNEVRPLPTESTVVNSDSDTYSLSSKILPQHNVTDTNELITLRDYSKVFKFILRKLKPEKGKRESLNYLYEKYKDWFKMFYSDQIIESQNEFNLIFYKLFSDFEGTYVLDIRYDNFKIISIEDNRLISRLNMIENNLHLVKYLDDNIEFKRNGNTTFNNINLDYSDWCLNNKIQDKKSSYELELFLISFFEKNNDNTFINLNIKNISNENNISKHYEVLDLFFKSNIESSEDNNLLLEEVYNVFVIWYSDMYPDSILIPQTVVLSYLKNNYDEIGPNIFSNLKIIDSNLNSELVKNNIVNNFFEDKLEKNDKGNLKFNKIYNDFNEYVKKFYPNYKIPTVSFLQKKLDEKFTKNKNNNYKLNIKHPLPKKKKSGFFGFIPKWLYIIIIILILLIIFYFSYIIIFKKPVDHFKGTILYRQFLPDFLFK